MPEAGGEWALWVQGVKRPRRPALTEASPGAAPRVVAALRMDRRRGQQTLSVPTEGGGCPVCAEGVTAARPRHRVLHSRLVLHGGHPHPLQPLLRETHSSRPGTRRPARRSLPLTRSRWDGEAWFYVNLSLDSSTWLRSHTGRHSPRAHLYDPNPGPSRLPRTTGRQPASDTESS